MAQEAQNIEVKNSDKNGERAVCFVCKKEVEKKTMIIIPYGAKERVFICMHHLHD